MDFVPESSVKFPGSTLTAYPDRMAESPTYHLAQYNVATLVAPLDDPRLDEFRASLDRINQLGDRSPGFVWRHKNADGNSTGTRVGDDPLVVINFTVWESI